MTVTDKSPKTTAPDTSRISPKLIKNVAVELEAYLGNVKMTVADLTDLRTGTVITLDAALNDPIELRLNGIAVARGELVTVDEKFAVRLSEIVQWPD